MDAGPEGATFDAAPDGRRGPPEPDACFDPRGWCIDLGAACGHLAGLGFGAPARAQGRCTQAQIDAIGADCGNGFETPPCTAARAGANAECSRCIFGTSPGESPGDARGRPSPVVLTSQFGPWLNDWGCEIALAGDTIPPGCGAALVDERDCIFAVCAQCEEGDQPACRPIAEQRCAEILAPAPCRAAFASVQADGSFRRACMGADPSPAARFASFATLLCGAP
jgi:hypothetical protein